MTEEITMKCANFLGKSFLLEKQCGKVITKEQWSETHVHGGGGGGNNGYNSPVNISSTVINKGKVWLLNKEGKEFTWDLTDTDLGAREGHILSSAGPTNESSFFAAYNHDLEKLEWWDSALSKYLSPPKFIGWIIILLPIIWLGATHTSSHYISDMFLFSIGILLGWGLVVGISWGVFVYIRKMIFTMRYKSAIKL